MPFRAFRVEPRDKTGSPIYVFLIYSGFRWFARLDFCFWFLSHAASVTPAFVSAEGAFAAKHTVATDAGNPPAVVLIKRLSVATAKPKRADARIVSAKTAAVKENNQAGLKKMDDQASTPPVSRYKMPSRNANRVSFQPGGWDHCRFCGRWGVVLSQFPRRGYGPGRVHQAV